MELKEHYWLELYPYAREQIPEDKPESKGKPVHITFYFDSDHAHDVISRHSVTGILIFINNTPVQWYSKRQNTV